MMQPQTQPLHAPQQQQYFAERNQLTSSMAMQPAHSDPMDSRFEAPLMGRRAQSDGAIIQMLPVNVPRQPHLPTPRNISDNTTPPVQSTTQHQPHRNPNYRLSLKNNLSNVQHMTFPVQSDEHAQSHHSPRAHHSPRMQPLPQSHAQQQQQQRHVQGHSTQLRGNYSSSTQNSYAQQQMQPQAQAYQHSQHSEQGYAAQRGQGGDRDDRHTIIDVAMDRDDEKGQSKYVESGLSGVEGGKEREREEVKEESRKVAYSQQQQQQQGQGQGQGQAQQHVYRDSVKRRGTMDNDEVAVAAAAAVVTENENSRSMHLYKQSASSQGNVKASNAEEFNGDSKQYIE